MSLLHAVRVPLLTARIRFHQGEVQQANFQLMDRRSNSCQNSPIRERVREEIVSRKKIPEEKESEKERRSKCAKKVEKS